MGFFFALTSTLREDEDSMFTSFHKRFLKRFIILLPFYSLIRLGFFLFHRDSYQVHTISEVLTSFIHGVRFDIAALCLVNAPLLLLSFISSTKKSFITFERFLFVFLNAGAIIISINDYELFNFTGKRLSLDFFLIADDILTQLPQILAYYWPFTILGLFLLYIFFFLDKKFFSVHSEHFSLTTHLITPILMSGFLFVGIRGGLQSKSINVQSAFTQGSNELGQLVLNTPYHFVRTLKSSRVINPRFMSEHEVKDWVSVPGQSFVQETHKNVVLIILESFSMEYMDEGYMPFLSSLSKEALFFDKHLANGRKSIEALPSLLCSIPSLLNEPFSKSTFQGNRITCFPDILKSHGYTNYFFHAGNRGTMGFDSFTRSHGFEKYFAREDYPFKTDFDGTWGIYDGPYLQYVAREISKMPEPFLAGVFTLSSHQPYSIPEEMKGKFNKGTLEIHESIGYTDFALKEFFEFAKTQEWYEKTLFVITSDHTQKLASKKYTNIIGQYRVPLLLFAPGMNFSGDYDFVTQHSDIPHTILDFLGLPAKDMSLMGQSILSSNKRLAFNLVGGAQYLMVQNDGFSILKDNEVSRYHYDWESGEVTPAEGGSESLINAYLQYFFSSLISNSFELK